MNEQTMHFIARPFVVPSNPCVFKLLLLPSSNWSIGIAVVAKRRIDQVLSE
jgi:hypothetical protein